MTADGHFQVPLPPNEPKFLVVDAAMNDLIRPALYQSYHEIVPVEQGRGDSPNRPPSESEANPKDQAVELEAAARLRELRYQAGEEAADLRADMRRIEFDVDLEIGTDFADIMSVKEHDFSLGDPLRAKYIAETFFDAGARCVNEERGMLGFTGSHEGTPVSVQATGMGCPSAAIGSSSSSGTPAGGPVTPPARSRSRPAAGAGRSPCRCRPCRPRRTRCAAPPAARRRAR